VSAFKIAESLMTERTKRGGFDEIPCSFPRTEPVSTPKFPQFPPAAALVPSGRQLSSAGGLAGFGSCQAAFKPVIP
jgi:hypothetical protein